MILVALAQKLMLVGGVAKLFKAHFGGGVVRVRMPAGSEAAAAPHLLARLMSAAVGFHLRN